jgi:hypothetical protein
LNFSSAGAKKLAQVRENSNYVRTELRNRGFEVLGDTDSPVMPVMLYNPAKIPAFSRECLKSNVNISSNPLHANYVVTCGGPGFSVFVYLIFVKKFRSTMFSSLLDKYTLVPPA